MEGPSPTDIAVACLLPLFLFFLGYHLLESPRLSLRDILEIIKGPTRALKGNQPGYFSVQRAILSYETYTSLAQNEVHAMRKSYAKLSRAHKLIGYDLGYTRKLNQLERTIKENATVTDAIAALAKEEFSEELESVPIPSGTNGDLNRVREALKHFVRDWSEEGREERKVIFTPILDVLSEVPLVQRNAMRVLIPGSGLGRLAWEISELGQYFRCRTLMFVCSFFRPTSAGYDTVAIELSSFMTLALRFLMSPSTTQQPRQHTLRPFSSWFSHSRSNDNMFRAVSFPDKVPREKKNFQLVEGDFLSHRCLPKPSGATGSTSGYDFIVTLFFIDTSVNVIATLEHIYSLLRPGGTWINLGPLLWTSGGQARLELSLEEVLNLAEMIGFKIQRQGYKDRTQKRSENTQVSDRSSTIECEYTADTLAMMRWIYKAEFWFATREK